MCIIEQIRKLVLLGFTAGFLSLMSAGQPAAGPVQLLPESINNAEFPQKAPRSLPPALIARAQILLDQANFSPGEIDAKDGENFKKALRAFAEANGLPPKAALTKEVWLKLAERGAGPAVTEYQISGEDLKGPFNPDLPTKMEDMKDLAAAPYTSAMEALAERFHMSADLLKKLNAKSAFDRAGETIMVANVLSTGEAPKASRVEISKATQTVRVFDANNSMIAFYPATVGSEEKPSPSGKLKVTQIERDPTYRYNPEYRFKGVTATKPFTIKPGPNNPVGVVWIGLSEKGYGIHGTPDPAKVSKAESHGCVRLTNWDAEDLAKRLTKGAQVAFVDERERGNAQESKRKRARKA